MQKLGADAVGAAPWISCHSVHDQDLVNLLRHDLGAGEAEAAERPSLSSMSRKSALHSLASTIAKSLGLKVVGLVGVLIEARERGLIPDAGSLMNRLHSEAGFWISEDLRKLVTG